MTCCKWGVCTDATIRIYSSSYRTHAAIETAWLHSGCSVCRRFTRKEIASTWTKCTCELVRMEFMTWKNNNEINTGFYLMVFNFARNMFKGVNLYIGYYSKIALSKMTDGADLSKMGWFLYVCKCSISFHLFVPLVKWRPVRVSYLNTFLPSDKQYNRLLLLSNIGMSFWCVPTLSEKGTSHNGCLYLTFCGLCTVL